MEILLGIHLTVRHLLIPTSPYVLHRHDFGAPSQFIVELSARQTIKRRCPGKSLGSTIREMEDKEKLGPLTEGN